MKWKGCVLMSFKEISAKDIKENIISMIADEWMLVCAGDSEACNMMSASWGFLGEMWNKDCAVAVVRPSRYTYEFLEKNEYFALCFMGERKDIHKICGSQSGRDIDKIEATGLTPVYQDGTVYFEESRVVLICRKLYAADLEPSAFIDKNALDSYGGTNYHRAFVGEIVKVLAK